MGRAHCYGYRVAPLLRLLPVTPMVRVLSGRDAAAAAGKAVLCEKPLAVTYAQRGTPRGPWPRPGSATP